jgi:hypothetical protein
MRSLLVLFFYSDMELVLFVNDRFDVAKILNMDEKSEVFETLLGHLQSDNDWGSEGMDTIFKQMNLKRYYLPSLKQFMKDTDTEKETETLASTSSGSQSSCVASIINGESGGSSTASITVLQSKIYLDLKSVVAVLKASRGDGNCDCLLHHVWLGEGFCFAVW